jgi:hypothetical protein
LKSTLPHDYGPGVVRWRSSRAGRTRSKNNGSRAWLIRMFRPLLHTVSIPFLLLFSRRRGIQVQYTNYHRRHVGFATYKMFGVSLRLVAPRVLRQYQYHPAKLVIGVVADLIHGPIMECAQNL